MKLQFTKYYDEFLYYHKIAKKQQDESKLGTVPIEISGKGDLLMENTQLFGIVNRKVAGFSGAINDMFYGKSSKHPYYNRIKSGDITEERKYLTETWDNQRQYLDLHTWLYIMLLHRVTGSGINYKKSVNGYHNSLLMKLDGVRTINDIKEVVIAHENETFYTSSGYQFPKFPKVPIVESSGFIGTPDYIKGGKLYKRAGDYFLVEYAPRLIQDLVTYLVIGEPKQLKDVIDFMTNWNVENKLSRYHFQYAIFAADIADWFPEYVVRESMFYYGPNAKQCMNYLATPESGSKASDEFYDAVCEQIFKDTNEVPYDAEDIACNFIRWMENDVKPGADFDHLDFDTLFNSSNIKDHPYGRQKAMLDLGLVDTFNGKPFQGDDKIIKAAGVSVDEYKKMCKEYYENLKLS